MRLLAQGLLLLVAAAVASPASAQTAQQAAPPDNAILDAALRTARALVNPYARAAAAIPVAEAYAAVGLPDKAREAMDEAMEAAAQSPLRGHLVLQAGEACVRAGLYDTVGAVAGQAAERSQGVYLLCLAAGAQFEAGLLGGALGAMQQARAEVMKAGEGESASRGWVRIAKGYAQAGMEAEMDSALAEATAQAGLVEATLDRSLLLETIATTCIESGRPDKALSVAELVPSVQVRIPLLCAIAEEHGRKGDAQQALAALSLAAQEAGGVSEPPQRTLALARVADSYSAVGRPDLARKVLPQAERSAARVQDLARRAAAWDRTARAYVAADDLEAAERIIRDGDVPARRGEQLADLAAEHAKRGHYEQAVRSLRGAEPAQLALLGDRKLRALADAYCHAWGPDAEPEMARDIKPDELRDAALARCAEAAAADGDYAKALRFATAVGFLVTRDAALNHVAEACLAAAGSGPAVEPAFQALKLVEGRLDKLKLRAQLAAKQVELGLSAEAVVSLGALARDAQQEQVYSAQAEVLGQVAVSYQRLGRTDEARDAAARAIAAAMKVACASCRDDVIQDLFELMSAGQYVEMALAAAQEIDVPALQADNFVRMYEMSKGLTPAQQEQLLRAGLGAAVRAPQLSHRVELLARLATSYDRAHLVASDAEAAMLRESYESIRVPEPAPAEPAAAVPQGPLPVRLVFFDQPGCKRCDEVKASFDELRRMVPNLTIETYVIGSSEGADLLNAAIVSGLSLPEQQRLATPAIFSSRAGLIGSEVTLAAMAELAQGAKGLPSPVEVFGARREQARTQLADAYARLGLAVVAGAGLADGFFNPCAFTVLIFFVAYLAHIGKNRREIGMAGIIFTVAVFLTYFGAGLVMVWLMHIVEKWSGIASRVIYVATAALALTAAVLSFRDGLRCLKGETANLTLGLPEALKSRIRLTISRRARLGLTLGATVVLGAVVAVFELPCTGQTYLPTIMFALRNLNQPVWGPLGWLLVYNLCFIAPLIFIFALVFFGLTSQRMTSFFRRHLARTKFAMAAVFAALFAAMIIVAF